MHASYMCTYIHTYTYTHTQVAGVQTAFPHAEHLDPALIAFETSCAECGLIAERVRGGVSKQLREHVSAGQTLWQQVVWTVCGYWDGMMFYKIRKKD